MVGSRNASSSQLPTFRHVSGGLELPLRHVGTPEEERAVGDESPRLRREAWIARLLESGECRDDEDLPAAQVSDHRGAVAQRGRRPANLEGVRAAPRGRERRLGRGEALARPASLRLRQRVLHQEAHAVRRPGQPLGQRRDCRVVAPAMAQDAGQPVQRVDDLLLADGRGEQRIDLVLRLAQPAEEVQHVRSKQAEAEGRRVLVQSFERARGRLEGQRGVALPERVLGGAQPERRRALPISSVLEVAGHLRRSRVRPPGEPPAGAAVQARALLGRQRGVRDLLDDGVTEAPLGVGSGAGTVLGSDQLEAMEAPHGVLRQRIAQLHQGR